MHDLWSPDPCAGHVKRRSVRGMQGPLEKQKDQSFCLTPAPGSPDAKAVLKHALENERTG